MLSPGGSVNSVFRKFTYAKHRFCSVSGNRDQHRERAHYEGRPDQSKDGGPDPSPVTITNADRLANPLP